MKPWSEVPLGKLHKAAPAELALARQIIDQLQHETFDPTQYTDEVKDRVRKLIAKKAKGGEIVAPPEVEKPVVTDLLEALKASLAGGGGNGHKPTRRPKRTPKPHAAKRPAATSHAPRRGQAARSRHAGRAQH